MEEQKEEQKEFVEEVIRKKPGLAKRIIEKMISLMGLGIVFGIGVFVIIFLLRDQLREALFADSGYGIKKTVKEISLALAKGDVSGEDDGSLTVEERIDRSMVTLREEGENPSEAKVLCSGVILYNQSDCYILASYEKIKDAKNLSVCFFDDTVARATVWNKDEKIGIAAVVVKESGLEKELKESLTSAVINGQTVKRSEKIIYEGIPYDQELMEYQGYTVGSSEKREWFDIDGIRIYTDVMLKNVTDGFLFDDQGYLSGMVLGEDYIGEKAVSALMTYEIYDIIYGVFNKKELGYFGVMGEYIDKEKNPYISEEMPDGFYVLEVDTKSEAYKRGIMAGDVIESVNGKAVKTLSDLRQIMSGADDEQKLSVKIWRKTDGNYQKMTIQVQIGERG